MLKYQSEALIFKLDYNILLVKGVFNVLVSISINTMFMKETGLANKITGVLIVIYLLVLFWILLFKFGVRFSYMETRSVNLIPFSDFLYPTERTSVSEFILNIIIFLPLGSYSGILFNRWSYTQKIFLFFSVSLIFEALQFILKIGAFDITDIITNTFGGFVGLLIWLVIEKLFGKRISAQRFVNVVAVLGTILMITLLILLKLQLLPIRYQ